MSQFFTWHDHEDSAEMLKIMLAAEDYEVSIAESLEEALAKLEQMVLISMFWTSACPMVQARICAAC